MRQSDRPKTRAKAAAPPVTPPAPTMAFEGTTALIRLGSGAAVARVLYDGHPLDAQDWRLGADGALRIACPPIAFDARAHTLEIACAAGAPIVLPFRSEYRGAIETVSDEAIKGWILDLLRPASALTLSVRCGDAPAFSVRNTLDRAGAVEVPEGGAGSGFAIALPPRARAGVPELVTITVEGSRHQPFGPILRGISPLAATEIAGAAARALGREAAGLLFGTRLLPALRHGLAETEDETAVLLRGTQAGPRPVPPQVDVIVPVYRGRAETLACLQSLLDAGEEVAHRIVVIDDCSPEPELSAALRALAEQGRIHYLRNEANAGFVASVNRGMALGRDGDVLLLNADTVVAPGFLTRLYRAAYSDPTIATATPLSNNATIFSLPAPPGSEAPPWGLATEAVDTLCQEANAGVVVDVPTGHGFCMFVKRAALDDVGLFNAEEFGAGYGEENDFCLRAAARGWRHVCAADVFVTHRGAVSFAAARAEQLARNLRRVQTLHPHYEAAVADFLRTDPLHAARNAVQKALWRRHERICLIVTLALAGGAVRHAEDLAARLTEEGWLVLQLRAAAEGPGITLRRADAAEALRYPAGAPIARALGDILDLAPRFIHVQHLIDLPAEIGDFVRDCGIPYAVTLHDFFYACPRVTMLDAGSAYCGAPPVARCAACLRQGPIHAEVHPSLAAFAESGEAWRDRWRALLDEAAQIIAPSQDTADRYAALFPGLTLTVRPHFAPPAIAPVARATAAAAKATLRVALPGALGPQKGSRQFAELARHCGRWHPDIGFVVLGHSDREAELAGYDNIALAGGYAPARAVATLAAAGCRVALLLSVFPETFSYTLSESLAGGLVPVAYDFGAIGERMRALGVGVRVPLGAPPEAIVAAIREAAAMPPPPPGLALYGEYRRLLESYYVPALADLAEAIPPPEHPRLLTRPAGLHGDRWCEGVLVLELWSARPAGRVALRFWVPPAGRLQAVEIAAEGVRLARAFLAAGETTRVVCVLPDSSARQITLRCRFDFVFRLEPPDIRACAAMLSGLEVAEERGWRAVDLPEAASPRADTARGARARPRDAGGSALTSP
jgi:GT2 family glycosyltransferase